MAVLHWTLWFLLAYNVLNETEAGSSKGIHSVLTQKLLSEYGPITPRPVLDVEKQIDVQIDLEIVRVIELNEKEQTLQQSAFLGLQWHDDYLTWNTSDYPGVHVLILPTDQIWRPDIHLYENVDRNFESLKDVSAWAFPDGKVVWSTPVVLNTACRIDARLFPFDIQHCALRFGSWAYDFDHMNLYPENHTKEAAGRFFTENGVWHLEDVQSKVVLNEYPNAGTFPEVVFTIVLHRRPLFHVFSFLLPCGLLSLLNLLAFILPTESGEKVSLGITNMLALVLFQQLISDSLPPSAIDMPVISYYFTPMILNGCMSIVSGVLVAKIYHHDKTTPVPKWLLVLTQIKQITLQNISDVKDEKTKLPGDFIVEKQMENKPSNGHGISAIAYPLNEPPSSESRSHIDYTSDWQRVTAAIDKLFFAVGVTMTVVAIIVTGVLFATSEESHL